MIIFFWLMISFVGAMDDDQSFNTTPLRKSKSCAFIQNLEIKDKKLTKTCHFCSFQQILDESPTSTYTWKSKISRLPSYFFSHGNKKSIVWANDTFDMIIRSLCDQHDMVYDKSLGREEASYKGHLLIRKSTKDPILVLPSWIIEKGYDSVKFAMDLGCSKGDCSDLIDKTRKSYPDKVLTVFWLTGASEESHMYTTTAQCMGSTTWIKLFDSRGSLKSTLTQKPILSHAPRLISLGGVLGDFLGTIFNKIVPNQSVEHLRFIDEIQSAFGKESVYAFSQETIGWQSFMNVNDCVPFSLWTVIQLMLNNHNNLDPNILRARKAFHHFDSLYESPLSSKEWPLKSIDDEFSVLEEKET